MSKRISKKQFKKSWGLMTPILRKDFIGQRMESKRIDKVRFIELTCNPYISKRLARKMVKDAHNMRPITFYEL